MLTLDHRNRPGFTIVELLIVIVVIAILAAITVVAFNGVQRRAAETTVQSDLRAAATILQMAAVESGSQAAITSFPGNVKTSANVALTLATPASGSFFCINGTYATNTSVLFYYDSKDGLKSGACSGAVIDGSTVGEGTSTPVTPTIPEPVVVVSDNFNRSNSTSTIGSTQTGQTWRTRNSFRTGTPQGQWGISSNRAYSVTATDNDFTVVDAGIVDAEVSVRMYGGSSAHFPGIIARGDMSTGSGNFYLIEVGGGRILLAKDVDLALSAENVFSEGDLLTARSKTVTGGVQFTVLVNNTVVLEHTDTTANRPAGTYYGMRYGAYSGASNALRYDDFTVKTIVP